MFDILFGWRKASKCKKLIKRVQCRLKLLKTKRYSIVRQLREDVAQLIKIGYEDIAFNRAEQLFKDETIMAIYELLENFCELIIVHISYIRRHKDCPNDINEAVSTLIFASARCGDLPELIAIRKLFRDRYGQRFEMTALELLTGNLVNFQVKEKLSIKSVPDDVKQKLVDEIAKDYCLRPEILALEYTSEFQQQAKEPGGLQVLDADVSPISTSISCSIVEQSSPDTMESPLNRKENRVENLSELDSLPKSEAVALGTKESQVTYRAYIPTPDQNEERKITTSSSESLLQFPDEMIVYLDDIEEVQHSISKEGSFHDQSIFKFKSPLVSKRGKDEDSFDVKYMDNEYESLSDCSSSSSQRRKVKSAKKRLRRKSASQENSTVKDIECVVYYDKPIKKISTPRSHLSQCSKTGESDTEMEWYIFPHRPRRRKSCEFSSTRKTTKPPYLRAMTMPQERSEGNEKENVLRSKSFPIQSPNHVHPKLPDYEELAAKFMALKKQHLQNRQNLCNA